MMRNTPLFLILLLAVSLVPPSHAQVSQDQLVQFTKYDIGDAWTNQTQEVMLWSNHTNVFANQQDQVTVVYTIQYTSAPVSVEVKFSTTRLTGNDSIGLSSSISRSFTIDQQLNQSRVTLTIDWTALLNASEFGNYISPTYYTTIWQYTITSSLQSATSLWNQSASIDYQITTGSRARNLGPSHFSVDASQLVVQKQSQLTQQELFGLFLLLALVVILPLFWVLRRYL